MVSAPGPQVKKIKRPEIWCSTLLIGFFFFFPHCMLVVLVGIMDDWMTIGCYTVMLRQNGRHFADDTFKCIFLNENVRISIKISLKFVLKGLISNIPALVHIMSWCWPGDKPLSEPVMVCLLTHMCVPQPQWVNNLLWTSDTSMVA